ncbi:unnamed protein product [Cylicostephanus goldi]|uniref:Uncharacterized protein n=1 Tax=Cylicostephanus goldi TaxID=71465 RepID=A0A3P6T4U7_CYLGO|nr:unnamed protein product [Cylicostephanus goldi]
MSLHPVHWVMSTVKQIHASPHNLGLHGYLSAAVVGHHSGLKLALTHRTKCLNRLFFVVCRVERSASADLPQRYLDDIAKCGKIWKRLGGFMVGQPEEDESSEQAGK